MSVINRRQATALVKRADRMCGEADFRALLAEVWSAGYGQAGAIEHRGVNPFLPAERDLPGATTIMCGGDEVMGVPRASQPINSSKETP